MLFQYLRDKKIKKKEGGSEKGGWKFTHFTSPGSAPGLFRKSSRIVAKLRGKIRGKQERRRIGFWRCSKYPGGKLGPRYCKNMVACIRSIIHGFIYFQYWFKFEGKCDLEMLRTKHRSNFDDVNKCIPSIFLQTNKSHLYHIIKSLKF